MGCQFVNYAFMGFYKDRVFFILGCVSIGIQIVLALYLYAKYLREKSERLQKSFDRSQNMVTTKGSPTKTTKGGPSYRKLEEKIKNGF